MWMLCISGCGGSSASPEAPQVPEFPEVPETLDDPEALESPEAPDWPEPPDKPKSEVTSCGGPNGSKASEVPETPDDPEAPETPEAPDWPEPPEKRKSGLTSCGGPNGSTASGTSYNSVDSYTCNQGKAIARRKTMRTSMQYNNDRRTNVTRNCSQKLRKLNLRNMKYVVLWVNV